MFPAVKTSTTDLRESLGQSQVTAPAQNAGKAFMKFDFKSGTYLFGRDQEEITGEEIAINTYSIQHGWTLWSDGSPQKVSAPFNQPLPEAMPAVRGDSPSESRAFEAAFLDADDDTILVFETNSMSGRGGVDDLLQAIIAQANSGSDYLFPVVKLTSGSFTSKQGNNLIHTPKFIVQRWLNGEGLEENVKIAAPKKRTRKTAAK